MKSTKMPKFASVQTPHLRQSHKILSWNILAHELMLYFWRSSYGLELVPSYDTILKMRLDNIISKLAEHHADVICLQEVTDTIHEILGEKTTYQYISDS